MSEFSEAVPDQDFDVCFLGDSHTQRGLWAEFFPELAVSNRGVGSDTSEGVLNRLDTVIEGQPNQVFLLVGVNDLARGVDPETVVTNIGSIVSKLQSELPGVRVTVQSLFPVLSGGSVDPGKVVELNRLIEEYCGRSGVAFLDLYPHYVNASGERTETLFCSDEVHLSGEGYALWRSLLLPYIE